MWFKRVIVLGLIMAVFIVIVNGVVIGTTQAYVFTSEKEVPKADVYMVLGAYVSEWKSFDSFKRSTRYCN